MDNQEKLNLTKKERLDLYQSKNPFKEIEPEVTGKYTSKTFDFAGEGDLVFYASPNIGQVDTRRWFKEPLRIWAELSLPEDSTQEDADRISFGLAINLQVRNNKSVILHSSVVNEQKIVFETATQSDDPTSRTNPLLEDASVLPEIVAEMTDDVPDVPVQADKGIS